MTRPRAVPYLRHINSRCWFNSVRLGLPLATAIEIVDSPYSRLGNSAEIRRKTILGNSSGRTVDMGRWLRGIALQKSAEQMSQFWVKSKASENRGVLYARGEV